MQSGKTIVAKRERQESDSERERVRKRTRRGKVVRFLFAVVVVGGMGAMIVKVCFDWIEWARTKEIVIEIEKEPTVEVIDEATGQVAKTLSSRVKELIVNLEEEFSALGYNVVRARIPADKIREVDLEIEGFSGVVKVSVDRNAAVSAEDGARMIKYLEGQGISEVQYVDVRVERKAYWK